MNSQDRKRQRFSLFGKTKTAAIKRYRSFINDGIAMGRRNNLVVIGLF